MIRYDLHCHSNMSDGTDTPREVVRRASRAGLSMLALTDHDTMAGVEEAMDEAKAEGLLLLPAVELDHEWQEELHILGLDVNPHHPGLQAGLALAKERRDRRNIEIISRLENAGYAIGDAAELSGGQAVSVSRLHIALALVRRGYARSLSDAFHTFLSPGKPGYYRERRFKPEESIALIRQAGGVPVLAHPCHLRLDVHKSVRSLKDMGLMGIEAYYTSSTLGETELFVSLARQNKLLITCGSDYHGQNRAGAPIGCAWRDVECLAQTAEIFFVRHGRSF